MTTALVHARAERLIVVDRGRDTILSDHTDRTLGPNGGDVLLRMTPDALRALAADIQTALAALP